MASNDPEIPDVAAVSEEDKKMIEKAFSEHGLAGVSELLNNKLHTWRSIRMRIAVIGQCKSGKSSFINAVRNLRPGDKDAAEVGICQVTKTITEYRSPDNPNLVYVDVPGEGTPEFPRETYLEAIKFDQYDFYIIVSRDTFTETDLLLSKEIKKRGKNFLYLRTKIDEELKNEKRDHSATYSEEEALKKMRRECKTNLKGIEDNHIYLISNPDVSRWDFPKLKEDLVRDFPDRKRDALIFSLRLTIGDTKSLILTKKKALQRRAATISGISAAAGLVPIPGVGAVVDIPIILHETSFYRRQLGLDDRSLELLSLHSEIALSQLQDLSKAAIKFSAESLLKTFVSLAAGSTLASVTKVILPVIGSIVGGAISYGLCLNILLDILDRYTKVALGINEYIKHSIIRRQREL